MKFFACFRKLRVERWILLPCLLTKDVKLLPALAQVLIDQIPVRQIERKSAKDVFHGQRGERFRDPFGRLPAQKRVDDGI
jgi:hypothetical protein